MSGLESGKRRRFGPYRDALKAISTRTGTPLPSLVVSFALLHELTAVVPLVGIFYGARALGIGERVVNAVVEGESNSPIKEYGWIREKCKTWVDEGESWAGRVGRRYGIFGFEKGQSVDLDPGDTISRHVLAGDVANAVFAYGATKASHILRNLLDLILNLGEQALLPVRIGVSLYLSPAFSRGIVEPFRTNIIRTFRRNSP